jgi:Protein of unknown function (DUF642)
MGMVNRWRAVLASALVAFGVGGAVLLTPATVSAGPTPPTIQNGNFGTINGTVPNDGYLTVNASDATTISHWTVDTPSVYSGEGAGSVDVVSSGYNDWGCDGSNNCIDLAGTPGPPGGLYQDVTTTIGEEYSLSFASAVNGDEATGISHTMGVTVTGVSDNTVDASDVVSAVSAGAPLQWVQNTVTFFASSAQSQIEFDDTTAGDTNQGPTLANVSLTAVPDVITASPVTPPIVPQTLGTTYNGPVATFTDSYNPPAATPTSFFTASINWGDGSASTTGTVSVSGSTYTVNGSHKYAADGTYLVGVTITSNAGTSASISPPDSISVANAVESCTGTNCNTNDNVNNENSQLNTQGTGAGFLELDTVSDSGTNTANCGDGFRHAPNVVQESNTFTPVGGTVPGTITAVNSFPIIDGTKGSGLEGLLFWVCFRSTISFKNLYGQTTPAGSAGLLPVCDPFKVGSGPCINYITLTKQGNVVEEVTFPAGDPWVR